GPFARARAFVERFGETFDAYHARIANLEDLEPQASDLDRLPRARRKAPGKNATPAVAEPPHPRRRMDPARLNTLAVEATQHFHSAYSWTDLANRLNPLGINLTPRGRGLTFTQGDHVLPMKKI